MLPMARATVTAGAPTLEQARAFVELERTRSFQAAAAALGHASPTSVYRLVLRFGEALGVGLLTTSSVNKHVELTDVGRQVLARARALLDSYEALRPRGTSTIRFSCYPVFAGRAAGVVIPFSEARQEIEVVFYEISDSLRADRGRILVERAASRQIDLAIAPSGSDRAGLVATYLYSWSLRVILHEADALRRRRRVSVDDLASRRLIVAPLGHLSRRLYDVAAARAATPPRLAMEFVDQQALASIARAGSTYAAVLPDDAFGRPDATLGPALVDTDGKEIGGSYYIYYSEMHDELARAGDERSQAIVDLAEALQQELGDRLSPGMLARRSKRS
jgi:DNA-binding transcriptional LysR family regulator